MLLFLNLLAQIEIIEYVALLLIVEMTRLTALYLPFIVNRYRLRPALFVTMLVDTWPSQRTDLLALLQFILTLDLAVFIRFDSFL